MLQMFSGGFVGCAGYTDLSLSDQVHLIECCWMELLLLNCAFRSMEHDGKHLVFAPDFHLDRYTHLDRYLSV